MSRQTKSIEEIQCDVCEKVTDANYADLHLRCSSNAHKNDDLYSFKMSGYIGLGNKIEDLCRQCAIQHLTIALDSLLPRKT